MPPPPTISGAAYRFRLRARLAIRDRRGAPEIGMFESGTHRVVPIPGCSIHHPLVNRVAAVVRQALIDSNVSCYSESSCSGIARYLQVVVERCSGRAQVVVVANSRAVDPLAQFLDLLRERLANDLHSLWFNSQCAPTNTILGPDFLRWHGPPAVIERFGGAAVHYPPGAFGQNNLEIAGRIVEHVRELVPQGARVAEFYAGVGAIGLSLLPRASALRLNEVSPQSLQGLEYGLADLDPADRARVEVLSGTAGAAVAAAAGMDVVIADPPRKGLDRELLAALVARPPAQFIYVSCGLQSFLADTARLTDGGRMSLTGLTTFNMMPYTGHVETVGCFEPRR